MRALLDGKPFLEQVISARSMAARMKGLLGRDSLPKGSGMLIEPCGSIHTLGMRFNLDVVFLTGDNCVNKLVRDVRPGRMVFGGRGARKVLEMQAGLTDLQGLEAGKAIVFEGA